VIPNPFGLFALIRQPEGALHARWIEHEDELGDAYVHDESSFDAELIAALGRYFHGEEETFATVPLPPGPPFFRECWEACRSIPRGEMRSYAWLSRTACGDAGRARAAGQAMRHNPLPIIVPCHRVVAADGSLHGFAGSRERGGPELRLKAALLRMEGAEIEEDLFAFAPS